MRANAAHFIVRYCSLLSNYSHIAQLWQYAEQTVYRRKCIFFILRKLQKLHTTSFFFATLWDSIVFRERAHSERDYTLRFCARWTPRRGGERRGVCGLLTTPCHDHKRGTSWPQYKQRCRWQCDHHAAHGKTTSLWPRIRFHCLRHSVRDKINT